MRTLETRTMFWQKRGAPVETFDAPGTEALTGSRYYPASSLDRRGGTINPLAYVRGLARSAIESGAPVCAHTPRIATIFPHLGPLEWEYQWAGWVGMTYDLNPHLHELARGLWAALGYSERPRHRDGHHDGS